MTESKDEKRTQQRITFNTNIFVLKDKFEGGADASTQNISINGLSISTHMDLQKGQQVSITLENPITYEKLRLLGEVTWSVFSKENQKTHAGIYLHPMDPLIQSKVVNLCQNIEPEIQYENPRTKFEGQVNLQSEIEKILHINPETPSKTADLIQPSTDADHVQPTMAQKNIGRKNQKKDSYTFRTILLFLLLLSVGLGYYHFNFDLQTLSKTIPKPDMPTEYLATNPQAVSDKEMNLDLVEKSIPVVEQKLDPPQNPADQSLYKNAFTFSSQGWLRSIRWQGQEGQIILALRFSNLAPGLTPKIKKLDFDPSNIRYLIQIPSEDQVLKHKEINVGHPLLSSIRLGLHDQVNNQKELHIVLDIADSDATLAEPKINGQNMILKLERP